MIHGNADASPHQHSSSLLVESNLEIGSRSAIFTRLERVLKNGEELGFLGGDLSELYEIHAVALGLTHRIAKAKHATLALGARGAVTFVPPSLLATYGTRTPSGLAVYLQLRPR